MSQMITIDRLKEIAETPLEDVDELLQVVHELAVAVLELKLAASQPAAAAPPKAPSGDGKRNAGKPLAMLDCRQSTCKRCGDDVAVFVSQRTGGTYICDMELGDYANKRQFLTGTNWLHKCGGKR